MVCMSQVLLLSNGMDSIFSKKSMVSGTLGLVPWAVSALTMPWELDGVRSKVGGFTLSFLGVESTIVREVLLLSNGTNSIFSKKSMVS